MYNENLQLLNMVDEINLVYITDSGGNIVKVPSGAYFWTTTTGARRAISYAISQTGKSNGLPEQEIFMANTVYYDEGRKMFLINFDDNYFQSKDSSDITKAMFNRGVLSLNSLSTTTVETLPIPKTI